jgi:sensor histidine kinase YesM
MNDRRSILLGMPALSLLITLLGGHYGPNPSLPEFLLDWGIALGFTAAIWLANRSLWMWLQKRMPRVEQTVRRLWTLGILSVLLTSIVTIILHAALHSVLPHKCPGLHPIFILKEIRFNMLPTGIVLLIYESTYFFLNWEQNVRRADQLSQAHTQAQLDALRGQLDPHFLFNNLNTLAALIEPENEPAQHFVEQLADVYRYVLLSQGQSTVPLAEELAFVHTYLALHKVRFRDNLQVEINICPAALARHVAPLSVQLLVENALKHNVASREQPLHLRLLAPTPDFLIVENCLRPRNAGLAPGTGMGLANIHHRYELLHAPHPVTVQATNGKFVVQLPLLTNEQLAMSS